MGAGSGQEPALGRAGSIHRAPSALDPVIVLRMERANNSKRGIALIYSEEERSRRAGGPMKTLEFRDGALWLLDQTKLPFEVVPVVCRDDRQVAEAIVEMKVRGAPAIGLAAAYGVVLTARSLAPSRIVGEELLARLDEA